MRALKRMTMAIAVATMATGVPVAAGMRVANADALTSVVSGVVDQDGHRVTAARFAGRLVLVNFIFSGCGSTCPMQTAQLVRFDRSLPPGLRGKTTLLSISVDPLNDTPATLKRFARRFGADTRHLSTAEQKQASGAE